jgi:hypothetical protein
VRLGKARTYCGEGGGDITVRQKPVPGVITTTRRVQTVSTALQPGWTHKPDSTPRRIKRRKPGMFITHTMWYKPTEEHIPIFFASFRVKAFGKTTEKDSRRKERRESIRLTEDGSVISRSIILWSWT